MTEKASGSGEYDMSTTEVMFRSDVDDAFRDNARIVGIVPLDSIFAGIQVLAGSLPDQPRVANATLSLARAMSARREEITVMALSEDEGDKLVFVIIESESVILFSTEPRKIEDEDELQLLRDFVSEADWSEELSGHLAANEPVQLGLYVLGLYA